MSLNEKSDSEQSEKLSKVKADSKQLNPFSNLSKGAKSYSQKDKAKKKKKYEFDNDSDVSFNSTKMIDGYKDFVLTIQEIIAKNAEKEENEKKKNDGAVTQRPKANKKKESASRTSKRATSVSSGTSAPLSAIYDNDARALVLDPDLKVEDTAEFDLNISFSGGYVPNTDLSRVDKGQGNPQFQGLDAN